jgi:hypothetical protein
MTDKSQNISFSTNWLIKQIQEEPVFFQAVVQATIALVVSFGLNLGAPQVGAIAAFSAAILSFITRQNVTSLANPKGNDGKPLVPQG